jgi:signal transduction histidine kinase
MPIGFFIINKFILFFINIAGIALALWVYASDRRSKSNQLFFLTTASILSWISLVYLASISTNESLAIILSKIAFVPVYLFLVSVYFFTKYFPREEGGSSKLDKIVLIGTFFLLPITLFTNLHISGVVFREWGVSPVLGSGTTFIYSIVFLITLLFSATFLKKYLGLHKEEKLKVQYFLIGFFIFVIMNVIFNVFLSTKYADFPYYLVGNYSAIFLIALTAYAIVKKNLFGIRIVLTALLVSLIALSMLIDIFFLTPDLLAKLYKTLLLVIFLYFGYLLIKSAIQEIQYREKLEKAYQELKKLDEAKSEFLSIASHQLRTPLSAIKGYISMLLEGSYGVLPEKAQKSIGNVYQSNERLIKLVNDILNVSRIEAGRIEMNFQKISLEEIINSVINELSQGAQRKNIILKLEKPTKPLSQITADPDKIRNIILNIIDNAIRYTDQGEVAVKVQIKNKVIIKIKDTGLGMTRKEIIKLFKSFSRGSAGNRSYTEGSGLGLYIAKRFVEMHHGKISAESEGLGKGSTFTIEIPIDNNSL